MKTRENLRQRKPAKVTNKKETKGRWTSAERSKFEEAVKIHGKDWKKIK